MFAKSHVNVQLAHGKAANTFSCIAVFRACIAGVSNTGGNRVSCVLQL
jgi:hypothetical protein